jgi:arsenate reductase
MKKIYHLATCQTCQKIIAETKPGKEFVLQNIKEEKITPVQLNEMKELAGSYDTLFTKRSMKFRAWNLQDNELTEKDKRDLILKEYTFLKRPVFVIGRNIFIGNAKATVEDIKKAIKSK